MFWKNFGKTPVRIWSAGVLIVLFLTALDQLSKKHASRIFLNSKFAFSLPVPAILVYIIYCLIFLGILFYFFKHNFNLGLRQSFFWLLILTGGFLNVFERLWLGAVRDFIYIHFFNLVGIYNLADFYILIGILGLLFLSGQKGEK